MDLGEYLKKLRKKQYMIDHMHHGEAQDLQVSEEDLKGLMFKKKKKRNKGRGSK